MRIADSNPREACRAGLPGTTYTSAVEVRQDMSPELRRRFQTGRPCLDFTHTGGDGEFAKWELLHTPDDAARFLGAIIGTEPPLVEPDDMAAVLTLRTAITMLARTRVATGAISGADAHLLNAAAALPPLVPKLTPEPARTFRRGVATAALSTLARDAIDLFSSPLADRIRVCEADDCGLLFVDTSRPGRRRWCSMQWCGDRQKKRSAGRPLRTGAMS